MSVIDSSQLLATGDEGYQISRSVRLRSSASAYFNRTPASAGSRTTWTWSGWVKRGALGAGGWLFASGGTSNDRTNLYFDGNDKLVWQHVVGGANNHLRLSTATYRDPSAWYHIVFICNSTSATAEDRAQIWVNGVRLTSWASTVDGAQNFQTYINNNQQHQIANAIYASGYFDGYLTEINFIDGQALTPSSFGETDSITGVWKPKKYAGTYGTNGFYLNFSDNSAATAAAIGKDSSGNGNNWTPNNISVTAGATYDSMIDTPTPYADGGNGRGNYCTWNPLFRPSASYDASRSITNGNLDLATGTNSAVGGAGTIAFPSTGKWYAEIQLTNTATVILGIYKLSSAALPLSDGVFYLPYSGGFIWVDNVQTQTSVGNASVNDIIGIAVNCDSNQVTFYKQNVQVGSTVTYTRLTSEGGYSFEATSAGSATNATFTANFGQRPFTYTPPTGFKALNTQNLPDSTIKAGNKYFDATTYTGTAANGNVIVNSGGFQPDLVWAKGRSMNSNHNLVDSVRGATKYLYSSLADAEGTYTDKLVSFNSNGFTLNSDQTGTGQMNSTNGGTYVAWQWKKGATPGFDIVTYTGNGSAGRAINHSLGVAPAMMIAKNRTTALRDWIVWHKGLSGAAYYLLLDSTAAQANTWSEFQGSSSTTFTVGNDNYINANGDNYVAYLFAEVAGFSRFGSYTGNGSTDGPFVFCGFRPKFVMIKRTDAADDWYIKDTSRDTYNVMGNTILADSSAAEFTGGNTPFDFTSNGFKLRTTSAGVNASGGTYIFMAVAENPFKYSLAR